MKKITILIVALLMAPTCMAAEITAEKPVIGCPTIETYEQYLEVALAGDGSATLAIGARLNCRMMFKGDKVTVQEWKMIKNLVRVLPEGNSMTFWLPGEFVSTD